MVPTDRKYTREHDWVLIEDGVATLGTPITHRASLATSFMLSFPKLTARSISANPTPPLNP